MQMDENDKALPNPPLWRVVKASAPEWYLLLIGVIASALDGMTYPIISVFIGRLLEVGINACNLLVFNLHFIYCIYFFDAH